MNKVAALGPHLEVKIELSDKQIIDGSRSVLFYWREKGADQWVPLTGCPYQEPYWNEFYQNWMEIGRMIAPGTWPKQAEKGATSRVTDGGKKKAQKSPSLGQSPASTGAVGASKNGAGWGVFSRKTGKCCHQAATRQEAVAWAKGRGMAPATHQIKSL